MGFSTTPIPDLLLFEPRVFEDSRGYFYESYNRRVFTERGITTEFVQDNQARSTFGVLRGLHYQTGASAQAKLVRVIEGEVFDVAVDLRPESPTYSQWYGVHLSAANRRQLYIPRGFAHGYLVLTPTAEFSYKCDNFYDPAAEGGLHYADPTLDIQWPIDPQHILLSAKDAALPKLGNHRPVS
jgi:dTDP-4-dehydrorhamnose 3,5-epimerase